MKQILLIILVVMSWGWVIGQRYANFEIDENGKCLVAPIFEHGDGKVEFINHEGIQILNDALTKAGFNFKELNDSNKLSISFYDYPINSNCDDIKNLNRTFDFNGYDKEHDIYYKYVSGFDYMEFERGNVCAVYNHLTYTKLTAKKIRDGIKYKQICNAVIFYEPMDFDYYRSRYIIQTSIYEISDNFPSLNRQAIGGGGGIGKGKGIDLFTNGVTFNFDKFGNVDYGPDYGIIKKNEEKVRIEKEKAKLAEEEKKRNLIRELKKKEKFEQYKENIELQVQDFVKWAKEKGIIKQ
jgi:hypothetical protein